MLALFGGQLPKRLGETSLARRLPRTTGPRTIRALERSGWYVVRRRGSHVILRHSDQGHSITVPNWGNKTLKAGTLKAIIRSAELSDEEFRDLL